MKKTGILNSRISAVVAQMGHKDTLAIGDAGLPVPMGTEKIDLAVKLQDQHSKTVLETVLTELEVEGITLAEEIKTANPEQLAAIKKGVAGCWWHLFHTKNSRRSWPTHVRLSVPVSHILSRILFLRSGVIFRW